MHEVCTWFPLQAPTLPTTTSTIFAPAPSLAQPIHLDVDSKRWAHEPHIVCGEGKNVQRRDLVAGVRV